jgi:hypothetical protein
MNLGFRDYCKEPVLVKVDIKTSVLVCHMYEVNYSAQLYEVKQ